MRRISTTTALRFSARATRATPATRTTRATRAPRATRAAAGTLAIAALLGACQPAPEPDQAEGADRDRTSVEGELDRVYSSFTRAYAEADVQMLMDSVYADSAYYLPPNSPILRGQDQFRGQFGFLEPFAREGRPGPRIAFEIVDREIRDDLAYDIGVYTIRPPDAAPGAVGSRGKFVVIWKRDDAGEWRIWADAFNPVD